MTIAEVVLLGPGEGSALSVLGDRHVFKATAQDTGGAYALWEIAMEASSGGPPPHVHEREDEAFYVLEGEMVFQIGERTIRARAGTFAFAPRGIAHKLSNPSAKPARALVIASPGGFEKGLQELAQLAVRGDQPPDRATLAAVVEKYGVKIVGAQ